MKRQFVFIGLVFIFISSGGLFAQYAYNVTYDENEMPHITAGTDINGVYGQGYEMAKAQGPLLYNVYAKAIGKWVKYYGGTHDLDDLRVQNDYRIALWRIPKMAQGTYRKMSREEKLLLRAFVDGINDAMASNFVPPEWRDHYPGDKEDFVNGIEPWHVVAAYMRYSFKPIVDRHVHKDPLEIPFDVRDFPRGNSNAWTLMDSGGNAWIQIDPHNHLGNDEYLMTFGCAMDTQQNYHWCGFNALGLPLLGVGVKKANPAVAGSQAIAWTVTAAPPDMADVYEVPWLNTMKMYKFDGRWRLSRNMKITIEFPDPNDNWVHNVPRSPDHGPLVGYNTQKDKAYFGRAVWQVLPSCKNFMHQWNEMVKANNMPEFFEAIEGMAFHGGNLIIASNSPNLNERVNYLLFHPTPWRGGIPNWEQIDWSQPIDGSMSENVWDRAQAFATLPRADGGMQDHFINCNCSIDITYPGFANHTPPYPDYLTGGLGIYTYRQERAENLFADLTSVDEDQMYDWITDKSNGYARYCVPDLLSSHNMWGNPTGVTAPLRLGAAIDLLDAWNRHAAKMSKAMLLFKLWMTKFLELGGYGDFFTFPSERPYWNTVNQTLCLDALNTLVEAYDLWMIRDQAGKGTWGKNNLFIRAIEGGQQIFEMPGESACLRSTHGAWQGEYDHIMIQGGQIVPMIIKLSLYGDPIIKYMKAIDNCTMTDSYMWNNTCPSTTRWTDEAFIDF